MRLETYRDKRGFWRWGLVAANQQTIADGSEGYSTKSNLRRAMRKLAKIDMAALVAEALRRA